MKDTLPNLSICIPTFNRFDYLKKSLDHLLPQAQSLGVEVCVSDNNSTDTTSYYLKTKAVEYSCLNFTIQKENLGIDGNMIAVIEKARGHYIFPLGDDDFLLDGALETILNAVNELPDVIVLNGWHTDADLVPKRMHLPLRVSGVTYHLPSDALEALWDKMPFGSFLASRECYLPVYSRRYIGTSHAYAGAIWDALAEKNLKGMKCAIKCMKEPTVMLRAAEKTWRKDAAKIMLYEIPLWFELLMANDMYKPSGSVILREYIASQVGFWTLLKYRALGQLNEALVRKIQRIYSKREIRFIRHMALIPVLPAAYILESCFRLKYFIKKIIKR